MDDVQSIKGRDSVKQPSGLGIREVLRLQGGSLWHSTQAMKVQNIYASKTNKKPVTLPVQ